MTWMVTGGAGFIGAHVVRAMVAGGQRVVVFDDLSTGSADKVPAGVPLVTGTVLDREALDAAIREHGVTGVVHVAGKKQVGESVERPLYYYKENVTGLEVLLESMADAGVDRLVFSSSAAVYGMPDVDLVTETTP
ncbi:NAD-dependent epimerase/dehydratase family protein, partial [Streptomyces rubiginosohelvolus]